jgi:hypothetical protein
MNEASFDSKRPKYDEAFKGWVVESLGDDAKGPLLGQLRHAFKRGAIDECYRSVSAWLTDELEQQSQEELAKWLGVNQSSVSRWMIGRTITLENLVSLLIELHRDINFPGRETLVVKGYTALLPLIREKLWDAKPPRPHDDLVWVLCALFSRSDWVEARKNDEPQQLQNASDRVLREVRFALGRDPKDVAGPEDLKRVVKEWGQAWVMCLYLIDFANKAPTWAIRGPRT